MKLFAPLCLAAVLSAQIPTPREQVRSAMRARPADPWPRGAGHVPLAVPGSVEMQKSYHEPGGSFSPVVRSFGVSLWVTSADGALVSTSDSIPLSGLQQSLVWQAGQLAPSIASRTAEYNATWSIGPRNGTYTLALNAAPRSGHALAVAIRSVGPAGDAIESLAWEHGRLRVNGRFSVAIEPSPRSVYVGPEGTAGWISARGGNGRCSGADGWCYARLELPAAGAYTLSIQDSYPYPAPSLSAASTRASVELDVPDARFAEALNAQVAHLMMSLVSNQTRPGEPLNYPLAWLRDGAYQVVALARAGRLETARELARYFAENDFFGGFGAEADSPGLSLWAITEVAALARDPAFDAYIWPHVRRKAEFSLGLIHTQEPVERAAIGPVVPGVRTRPDLDEVAKPAAAGLVSGRMDHAIRPLYTSAVTYRGLTVASAFALRLREKDAAARWSAAAQALQQAWLARFTPADRDERTFMSGLFPTWIAAPRLGEYRAGLLNYWERVWHPEKGGIRDAGGDRDPLWTYFNFAHANNWLYAGRIDPVWKTLAWFWDHQASPGLYTCWEGNREENTSRQWEYVRGWVNPRHVTPHYWTAATHLLLQLEMLVYVDESAARPRLVLGGGVPAEWCSRPMHVRGLLTRLGAVDWTWDGKTMRATVHGERCQVALGPAFPNSEALDVKYEPALSNSRRSGSPAAAQPR